MNLYITESNVKIGLTSNRLTVKKLEDGTPIRDLPFSDIDGISLFGKPQLSTHLLCSCISNSIPVSFYSEDGHYIGYLASIEHIDPDRQRKQIYLSDNAEFCLPWAKRIVRAKLENSLAMLNSLPDIYKFDESELSGLYHSLEYLDESGDISQVMGFEGNGAKCYFSCLPKLLKNEDFFFSGRSTRPPKDPFNAMISYGYTLIQRNILGAINASGLHPYFAFMHTIKPGHAALASDLMEEWRSWLVDRIVVNLINEGEVTISDFSPNENGGIYMQKWALKLLTDKIGDELVRNEAYLFSSNDRKKYGFQVALHQKILMLIKAIEAADVSLYPTFSWSELNHKEETSDDIDKA